MKTYLLLILLLPFALQAQDTTKATKSFVTFSAYADIYYAYDFNDPKDNNRPGFIYQYSRHNEVALNLGFIKASYSGAKSRATDTTVVFA